MVFAALYRDRKQREAREEGHEEGRAEANAAWEEWNRRRMAAEASGEPLLPLSPRPAATTVHPAIRRVAAG